MPRTRTLEEALTEATSLSDLLDGPAPQAAVIDLLAADRSSEPVIRTIQAKRFWNLGIEMGKTFQAYLAHIPGIPADLLKHDAEYPLLVLVEPRIGLKMLCGVGGIQFTGHDETFVAYYDQHREFDHPTWIRIQDGRKNRNRSVRDCRKSFGKHERGLTALQGVCAYLHHPSVVSEATQDGAHVMDLSGTVLRVRPDYAAYLKLWNGQPGLDWSLDGYVCPRYGSASRWERKAL